MRDPLVWVGGALWLLVLLPSLVPVLPQDLTRTWGEIYSDVPLLLLVLALTLSLSRAAARRRERGFWRLLAGATCALLAARAAFFLVPESRWGQAADLTVDLLYVAMYFMVALALERRPDRAAAPGSLARLHAVEAAGALVFGFGLLVYIVLIPSVYDPAMYASWAPSLLLFATLDVYLVLRAHALFRACDRPEWRRVYGWLAATAVLWLFADGIEGLIYLDAVPWVDSGRPTDAVWLLPLLTMILAVRSRVWHPVDARPLAPQEGPPTNALTGLMPGASLLLAFLIFIPLLHGVAGVAGLQNPATTRPQGVFLLVLLGTLVALLAYHQHLQRRLTHTLEEDRRQVVAQLQTAQRMEAVGRLAAGVAHDFANILSVIRGRCDFLTMSPRLGTPERDDLDEIVEASQRGAALVTQLLALSRRKAATPVSVDLAHKVTEMSSLFDRVLPESVSLRITRGRSAPWARIDPAQAEQVVLNLVINAGDALPGGGRIHIETDVVELDDTFAVRAGGEEGGTYAVLRVLDNGPGFPPELRESAFEPFFTTKAEEGHSGLGLSIVYGAAHQAGGFARIADAPGGGASVEVYLPLSDPQPAAPVPGPLRRRLPLVGPAQETILVVEDHAALRATAVRALAAAGFRVLEADTGAEALGILERRKEPVDLLVADVVLPDISGFEVLRRARSLRPRLVTLFTSGYPQPAERWAEHGGHGFLKKPFSPEQLAEAARRTLDAHGTSAPLA